jgi:transposase-like protein
MAAKRKQDDLEFKLNVVMESFQRETTLQEVCRTCGVSSSIVSRWRQAFQERGAEIFADQREPMRADARRKKRNQVSHLIISKS